MSTASVAILSVFAVRNLLDTQILLIMRSTLGASVFSVAEPWSIIFDTPLRSQYAAHCYAVKEESSRTLSMYPVGGYWLSDIHTPSAETRSMSAASDAILSVLAVRNLLDTRSIRVM